ncbi:MAG: formylmethanofuran dehydrogenase subunit A, partial [Planctomycetales bacterium]|nr:formylmethanofuran dehydrogenase subunit A [Planctomycetales bacterium]
APARILGLADKGRLSPGADADITIYTPHDNAEIMFSLPRHVLKSGELIVEDGDLRAAPCGQTLHTQREYDPDREPHIAQWFAKNSTVAMANFGIANVET